MGLDNGIIVNVKKEYLNSKEHEYFFECYSDFMEEGFDSAEDLEICYWRKFWPLRGDIMKYLVNTYHTDEEEYEFLLSEEDLLDIRDICVYYIDNCERASDIWSRASEVKQLANAIASIEGLYYAIHTFEANTGKKFSDYFEVYFYDSY